MKLDRVFGSNLPDHNVKKKSGNEGLQNDLNTAITNTTPSLRFYLWRINLKIKHCIEKKP